MADCHDGDGLSGLLEAVGNHIVADDEPAKIRIDPLGERPSRSWLLHKDSDTPEEIRYDSLSGRRVVFRDEVQEFGDPFQGGIRPEDLVGH